MATYSYTNRPVEPMSMTVSKLRDIKKGLSTVLSICRQIELQYNKELLNVTSITELENWRNQAYLSAELIFLDMEERMRGGTASVATPLVVENPVILIPPLFAKVGHGDFQSATIDNSGGGQFTLNAIGNVTGAEGPFPFAKFKVGDIVSLSETVWIDTVANPDTEERYNDDGIFTISAVYQDTASTLPTADHRIHELWFTETEPNRHGSTTYPYYMGPDVESGEFTRVGEHFNIKLERRTFTSVEYTDAERIVYSIDMLDTRIKGLRIIIDSMLDKLQSAQRYIDQALTSETSFETINTAIADTYDDLVELRNEYCERSEAIAIRPKITFSVTAEITGFNFVNGTRTISVDTDPSEYDPFFDILRSNDYIQVSNANNSNNDGIYRINAIGSKSFTLLSAALADVSGDTTATITLLKEY